MHLQVRLKNWRSIDDATIYIAPFTVVVGRNSSGKSNIVDALLFSSEAARDAETAVSRRGGIASIRRWSPSRPYDVTVDVRVAGSKEKLEIEYVGHELVLRSGKDGAWHFARETITSCVDGEPDALIERRGETVEYKVSDARHLREPVTIPVTTSAMLVARQLLFARRGRVGRLSIVRALRPVPEQMRQPQPPTEAARLVETASNITTALHRLKKDEHASVVQAMQRIVPGLTDIQAPAAGRYRSLSFKQAHGDDRNPEFAATEMSDGALRALAVIVAAQQMMHNELLIIEEPETSLHPGAADVVYDVLHRASARGAVLVTTHSPELLDRAKDDHILVCEYVGGVTKIGPLAEEQRDLVREGLFSTAELMRSESLRREGAPPRLVQD